MQVNIAFDNYQTLKELPAGTRLRVEGMVLVPDSRWFSSARRRMEGSSRENIIEPIRTTFITVHSNEPPDDFYAVLKETEQKMINLYGPIKEFLDLFMELQTVLAPAHTNIGRLDEVAVVIASPPIGSLRKRNVKETGDVVIEIGTANDFDQSPIEEQQSKCVLLESTFNWFKEVFGCQK